MASSLKPLSAVAPGLSDPVDWRVVPGRESETVLKAPRGDSVEAAQPSATPTPSFWKQLFPAAADGAPLPPTSETGQGVTLGHFTIELPIGSGSMGSVFLAYDERLHRQVALKVLAPSQAADGSTVQRFQNEAQAAARLDHEHVARVYYYGEEGGLHFIAYEFVAGINLRDLIRQRGRLSPAEAVNYAIQIATALRHTSRHGVVHRDIKPSNIIVTPHGRAKLVDLGLAKRDGTELGGELTVAGTTLGTFDYISPEQARDPRTVDVRSDIYSLGCTLYHLLTGEPPYPEGTVLQKLLDHQAHETPDVGVKNRRVSPAFSAVIKKMMASDVKRRYSSPEELLRDLAVIARNLGLRVVASDSAALVPERQLQGTWWDRNFGWVLTAAALGLIVASMSAAPELLDKLTAWSMTFGTSPRTPTENNGNSTIEPSGPQVASLDSPDAQVSSDRPKMDSPRLPALPAADVPAVNKKPQPTEDMQVDAEQVANPPVKQPDEPKATPTPTPVVEESLPAVSIVTASGRTAFPSLEQACHEAKDGDIIELRWDGARQPAEQSLKLTNKRLTIRAAKGFRPRLDFSDAGRNGEPTARLIAVSGGSLQLRNLDIVAQVSPTSSSAWSLIHLERPEGLKLDGVTVTVVNPRRRPASVIELGAAGAAAAMPKTGMSLPAPEIELSNCVVRGAATLIALRDFVAGRCSLEDSLFAIDESLLLVQARPAMGMGENQQMKLELLHTTVVTNGNLIVTRPEDNFNAEPLPLKVYAQNNLISVGRDQPLIDLTLSEAMELRRSFEWSGERNLYNDLKTFWIIRSRENVSMLDFAAWKEFWGSDLSGSANTAIRWVGDLRAQTLSELRLNDVELATSGGPNPAVNAATDGTDLGAPLDALPALPEEPRTK